MKIRSGLSMRVKLWISYLLVLIIPVFLMATLGYYWLKRNIDEELLQQYTAFLNDVIRTIDENFEQMDSICNQLAQTVWINKLVNMQGDVFDRNRVNAYDIMEYQQFIYACQQSIPGSLFLGVYFPRKNYIVSSRMNGSFDFLLYDALSIRSITKEAINEKITGLKRKETFYHIDDEIYQYGKKGSGFLVFKSILNLPDSTSPGAVLISYISRDRFLRVMETSPANSGYLSLSIDDNGSRILYKSTDDKGEGAFFIKIKSPVTGWDYELVASKPELLNDIVFMRNILLLIVIGTMIICLLVSSFFTVRIYRPIKETLELLAVNTIYRGDELAFIKSDIAGLIRQRNELQKLAQEQSPILISYYYGQLIFGPKAEHDFAVEELKRLLEDRHCLCRVCLLFQKTQNGIILPTKPAPLVQSLLDKPGIVGVYAMNHGNRTLLVLQYDSEEDFSAWYKGIENQFPDSLIACGYAVDSLADLSSSFADANRICDFKRMQLGQSDKSGGYYLPFEDEVDLIIALRRKNYARSESLVRKILSINTGTKNSTDTGAICRGLYDLLCSVSTDIPLFPEDLSNGAEAEWIFQQIKIICAYAGASGKQVVDPKFLMELVNISIQNPNISLKYIADRFDVSGSLISKVFKDYAGKGFNKYINVKRIEMAKNLLAQGYEVIVVAKMVGYANDTTFRRCFESELGLSPTEYRQQSRRDE